MIKNHNFNALNLKQRLPLYFSIFTKTLFACEKSTQILTLNTTRAIQVYIEK